LQALKEKILAEGQVIGETVLKVDSFLNHQVDPKFTMEIGRELAGRFRNEGVTKVFTVEASGIAVAVAVGLHLDVPVVFAKKKKASTQDAGFYYSGVHSYTRQESVNIYVSSKYLNSNDVVLIIDDFLALGEALRGMVDIVKQAGARLAGVGIVIEKAFQKGGEALRLEGVRIESLAAIKKMSTGNIEFC